MDERTEGNVCDLGIFFSANPRDLGTRRPELRFELT